MDLIDREALLKSGKMYSSYEIGVVKAEPAVDATPVVYGEWIRDHGDYGKLICSRCECRAGYRAKETELGYHIFNVSPSNFCPNCGAKMRTRRN